MEKTVMEEHLKNLGFEVEELPDYGFRFEYEGITLVYLFDDDDEFMRIVAPRIFDVTDENRSLLLDIANDVNIRMKYTKTLVYDDSIWVSYEHHYLDESRIEDDIEHVITLLQATTYQFYRKINGDDDDDSNNGNGDEQSADADGDGNDNGDNE